MNNNNYPPDTAGRLMISNVPIVSPEDTIEKIEEMLMVDIKKFETINYIYVVYKNKKLAGVISIKDILRQPKSKLVSEVMIKNLVIAHPYTDQEKVAYLAFKKNIKAVPIIDKEGTFLGIVPSDKILEIAYDEARQDLLSLAGVANFKSKIDDTMSLSIPVLLKHRLPWLLLGLLGGILTAQIISMFEETLEKNLILASFIPLIVYMGGATLAQTQAFFIRDMALNPKLKFSQYFFKQLIIILSIALSISLIITLFALIFYNNFAITEVLVAALFSAILISLFTGLIVPYIFSRFKLDPANASGPIATIIQDLLGVSMYFAIASLLL